MSENDEKSVFVCQSIRNVITSHLYWRYSRYFKTEVYKPKLLAWLDTVPLGSSRIICSYCVLCSLALKNSRLHEINQLKVLNGLNTGWYNFL